MSNILDSRDLNERLEELSSLKETLENAHKELTDVKSREDSTEKEIYETELEDAQSKFEDAEADFGKDEAKELEELENLRDEISEWQDGATLIPESEFTDYCKELLEDIGDLPSNLPWYIAIDWDKTADNLRADYSEVEYQDETYLVRA